MATPKTYTLAQVKKQCSLGNDVWIVLHDKVYNVTKFLSEVCWYGNWPIIFFVTCNDFELPNLLTWKYWL